MPILTTLHPEELIPEVNHSNMSGLEFLPSLPTTSEFWPWSNDLLPSA